MPGPKQSAKMLTVKAKNLTPEESGRIGGFVRAARLTKTRRRQIARQAALARWHPELRAGQPYQQQIVSEKKSA